MSVGLTILSVFTIITIVVLSLCFFVDYGYEVLEIYNKNARISCSYDTLKQLLSQLINNAKIIETSNNSIIIHTKHEMFTLFRYGIKATKGYSSKLLYTNFFSIIQWWILLNKIKHSLHKKLKEKKINTISSLSVDTIFSDITLSSTEVKETLRQIINSNNSNNHSTEPQEASELEETIGFKILK